MTDEILVVLVSILIIALQILLIYLNMETIENEGRMGLYKSIVWTIATLLIFPALLTMALQVTLIFPLAYVSLCLLFIQIFLNVEYILMDHESKNESKNSKNKYR